MKKYYSRNSCRVCFSQNVFKAVPLKSTPIGDAYHDNVKKETSSLVFPLDLYICEKCGLGQLLDVVSPELLYGDFIYETAISVGLKDHFKELAENIISKFQLSQKSFIFDIGSNDGTLLKNFKLKNMSVLGCEPAYEIAQRADENGVPTITDYFSDKIAKKVVNNHGIPDVITSNNTIANIDDLDSFIGSIKLLLTKNNVFIFETGYLLDIVKKGLFDTVYHEHLSYFSVMSLDMLFKKNGLELFDIELINTKGGSIRGFVQSKNGFHKKSNSVLEQIEKEKNFKINQKSPYDNLNLRLREMKNDLATFLTKIKANKQSVCGYGASVGVTTFLYFTNVASQIEYLFDDNPAKYDLYSPGNDIKVLNSKYIYDIKPDYIIIFAWRYASFIMNNHKLYSKKIGKFFLPWPTTGILDQE